MAKKDISKKRETVSVNSKTVRDFCIRRSYYDYGGHASYGKLLDAADDGAGLTTLAAMIWVNSDTDSLGDVGFEEQVNRIALGLEAAASTEEDEARAAADCAAKNPDLVERIIEVSKWSPIIFEDVTKETCVLLESSTRDGEVSSVTFRSHGLGYTIDFTNHVVSRNISYDLQTEPSGFLRV